MSSLLKTASWIIRNKEAKDVVMETYNENAVKHLNTAKYEAVPILEYLQNLNKEINALAVCAASGEAGK